MHTSVNPFEPHKLEGLVDGMTMEEYHAAEGTGHSKLQEWLNATDPWSFNWVKTHGGGRVETDAMRLGTACHIAVLEPDLFDTFVCIYEGTTQAGKPTTVRKGAEWEEFKSTADAAGVTVLTATQMATCQRVREFVAKRKGVRELLSRGMAEKSFFWQDEITGALVKTRPDFVDPDRGFALDLKFSEDISPRRRVSSMVDFGYAMQGYMFLEGANRFLDGNLREACILWVKTKGAPEVELRTLSADWLAYGKQEYRKALDAYAKCLETDTWPRGPIKICDEFFPEWVQNKLETPDE